ncbi:aminopeptidase N [Nocardioides sp.]|uniref:aminopeptidase N n=1 Tax=Nocardioides sp. TaxID=35761 RepID=UPI0035281C64
MTAYHSLRRDEAAARAALLDLTSYDVTLDLASDEKTFRSRAVIRFSSRGGDTFCDLKPLAVHEITLDGRALDADSLRHGRLPLATTPGEHELLVDATMVYRHDGEGLHRATDPADGRPYVYGMSFMEAAPSIFACFDQPDLKAPFTLHVSAPLDWVVVANGPGEQVEPGEWEFATTPPLSTYFVTVVAGPYHWVRDHHDGIPLGLLARASLARDLDRDAEELFTLTRQCFDELHRLFGIRYPFGDYHQAFVPEFNAGAMENPGCVTFRDPLIFTSKVTRGRRITRATTIAHEMAHQWFGNLTTPVWWDDLWLNESFAEYMGVRVTAAVTQYADAHTHHAYSRRQWGLMADRRPSTHPVAGNGAMDAASALQDFDGISYAKGSAVLKLLNARLGDETFLRGVIDHFQSHRFGNATMHDLFASWERAADQDLSEITRDWLRTAGVDRLTFDRATETVRRTPPDDHPGDRRHTFRAATASPGGAWTTVELAVEADAAPYAVDSGAAVLLDPYEDTWAVPHVDPTTVLALPSLMPDTHDPDLRAGVWNALASTFHDAALDPEHYLDVLVATVPTEDNDDALVYRLHAALPRLASLVAQPDAALARLHVALDERLTTAPPGSPLQLAAAQNLVATSVDAERLDRWLAHEGLPEGLDLDLDLRWAVLERLAQLGAVDRERLHRHLEREITAVSRLAHLRSVTSLPDAAAKELAWAHFTGDLEATNYEIEAAGTGMWQPGQLSLTEIYVDRYVTELPDTTKVREGWVLGDAAKVFFPLTHVDDHTLSAAERLAADQSLDPTLRRAVIDSTDELARRLAVRARYAAR